MGMAITPLRNMAIVDASSILTLGYSSAVASSTASASYLSAYAVDNSMNPSGSTEWRSASSVYHSTTGVYNGTQNTTYNTDLTVSGEWIGVTLNTAYKMKYYSVQWFITDTSSNSTIPRSWRLLGSTDNTTWKSVDAFTYPDTTPPVNTQTFPFLVKMRNVYQNEEFYRYYRLVVTAIFGGGGNSSYSYARLSEWDLFQENAGTYTLPISMRPLVTRTHLFFQTNIVPFSAATQKQSVYLVTDLCANVVDSSLNNGYYTSNILNGVGNQAMTSHSFDGTTMVATTLSGNVCIFTNTALNTNLNMDVSYGGNAMNAGISGNLYASCYNGRQILVGGSKGTGNNVITYLSRGVDVSPTGTFMKTINANQLFTSVNGLASNPGYGPVYTENRIYFSPNEKVSIVGPKYYSTETTPNHSITMNLTSVEMVQNITLPTSTDIQLILGPPGPIGQPGPIGPTGWVGNTGDVGETGPLGNTGTTGTTGIGYIGNTGFEGVMGPDTGDTGSTGNGGPTGSYGGTGMTGIMGPMGSGGLTGPLGPMNYDRWVQDVSNQLWVDVSSGTGLKSVWIGTDQSGSFPVSTHVLEISGNMDTRCIHATNSGVQIANHSVIQNNLIVGSTYQPGTRALDVSGQVFANALYVNTNTVPVAGYTVDVSGIVFAKIIKYNKLYYSYYNPLSIDSNSISVNSYIGHYYVDVSGISNDFIVSLTPLLNLSPNQTYHYTLLLDYTNTGIDRYLASSIQFVNFPLNNYPICFTGGKPASIPITTLRIRQEIYIWYGPITDIRHVTSTITQYSA